jgi:hypothetical protein
MPTPLGISSQGTIVSWSPDPLWPPNNPIGGSVTFLDIAELKDITPPALTRNELETTNQNSGDDNYVVGIRRHATMTLNMNFVGTAPSHDHLTGLQYAWYNGLRRIYRITYPDGVKWLFSGFVTNIGPSSPLDGVQTADVSIRPTGGHSWQ